MNKKEQVVLGFIALLIMLMFYGLNYGLGVLISGIITNLFLGITIAFDFNKYDSVCVVALVFICSAISFSIGIVATKNWNKFVDWKRKI